MFASLGAMDPGDLPCSAITSVCVSVSCMALTISVSAQDDEDEELEAQPVVKRKKRVAQKRVAKPQQA